jgi:hypothetical protein
MTSSPNQLPIKLMYRKGEEIPNENDDSTFLFETDCSDNQIINNERIKFSHIIYELELSNNNEFDGNWVFGIQFEESYTDASTKVDLDIAIDVIPNITQFSGSVLGVTDFIYTYGLIGKITESEYYSLPLTFNFPFFLGHDYEIYIKFNEFPTENNYDLKKEYVSPTSYLFVQIENNYLLIEYDNGNTKELIKKSEANMKQINNNQGDIYFMIKPIKRQNLCEGINDDSFISMDGRRKFLGTPLKAQGGILTNNNKTKCILKNTIKEMQWFQLILVIHLLNQTLVKNL